MKKNSFDVKFLIISIFLLNFQTIVFSEIMLLTECKNLNDGFIKNEYILDFEKSLMTRNYIYDSKTYKKYKVTDLSIKREGTLERFIYEDKKLWKSEDTSGKWKNDNLTDILKRLSGWQLESFKDSYNYKIESGISLFKKNLNDE